MQVFVLVKTTENIDGEIETKVVGVYESFSMAEIEFKAQMVEAKQDFQNYDYEQTDYVEGDMSWSIWETRHYSINQVDLSIQCKTVE